MDLEVHEMKQSEQPRLKTRMESYKVELVRLCQEFKRSRTAIPTQDGVYHEINFISVVDNFILFHLSLSFISFIYINNFCQGFHDHMELYGESISLNEEQKQRLLDNTERLERTGRQLDTGYQILLETEEIGSQVLQDLASQRETIQKSRSRVSINK